MNPFKLFDLSYLLNTRPGSEFMYFWPLLILMGLAFAGSFFLRKKELAARLREFSILALFWTFFRDQNIPYLSMRLWMVLLVVLALGYGLWYWKKSLEKEEVVLEEDPKKKTLKKYLPKKKKKH